MCPPQGGRTGDGASGFRPPGGLVLLGLVDLDASLAALRPLGDWFLLRTGAPPHPAPPALAQVYEGIKSDVYGDSVTFRVRSVRASLAARARSTGQRDGGRAGEPTGEPGGRRPEGRPDGEPVGEGAAGPSGEGTGEQAGGRTGEPAGATVEERVAASIAHQGLAARLWSVALGSAVLHGSLPDLDPALLHWDPSATAPDDLWLTGIRPLPGDPDGLAHAVLDRHLTPLGALLRARYRLPEGLLRGNAASALHGSAAQLARWAHREQRPAVAARTRALTAALLARPPLDGAWSRGTDGFRRRSCCLYYRVPGGGLCGDCCLKRPLRPTPRTASG